MSDSKKTTLKEKRVYVSMLPKETTLKKIRVTISQTQENPLYPGLIHEKNTRKDVETAHAIEVYEKFYQSFWEKRDWATYPKIYSEKKFTQFLTNYSTKLNPEKIEKSLQLLHEHEFIERNVTGKGQTCLIPTLKGLNLYYNFLVPKSRIMNEQEYKTWKLKQMGKSNKFTTQRINQAKQELETIDYKTMF